MKAGNTVVGCLDTCTQCQRTAPIGSTPDPQVYAALKCNTDIATDVSDGSPALTTNCSGATGDLPTYQDMYCVQHLGEAPANAQASSNQGTDTAFSQLDCFPGKTFVVLTFPASYTPPTGVGVCLYTHPPQSTIPHFNDYGWFDFQSQKIMNCGGTAPDYTDVLPDGTPCGGYLTGQLDTVPDGSKRTATYPGALGYTCQTVAYDDSQGAAQSAHLCLPPTTSGLGTCTRDTLGLNPLYTGVGGLFNASWLTAGLQAGDGTTPYYETFKAKCPFAYTWQYDDSASGYGCNAIAVPNGGQAFSGFDVTFCGSAQLAGPGGLPPSAVVAFQGHGKALGVGKRSGVVRISGHIALAAPIELDDATVTITDLLDEVGGVGELTGDILPVTLTAGPGSKPNRGFYRTRPGKQLNLSMEIKTRHPRWGLMEFSIMLDRATLPVGPARCAGGPPPTTRLETSFDLRVGSHRVVVGAILPWQCRGSKLKTP